MAVSTQPWICAEFESEFAFGCLVVLLATQKLFGVENSDK